jgi:glyoxylase-like metal-dependent hydrolase (beta-lactamase superfamily II)
MSPSVQSFYDPATGSITHVVHGGPASACAIIDPVLDYDAATRRTSTQSAERVLAFVREAGLAVAWILETHAHADHLSAALFLQQATGGRTGISVHIREVQQAFLDARVLEPGFAADGSQFDHLFADGESFAIGALRAQVLHLPGHTPASVAYWIGDCAFVGDTLLRPDLGSARCDFPGGDARALYRSAQRLLSLPPATRLFLCHDYPADGTPARLCATVAEQRSDNVHLHEGIGQEEFVWLRSSRDAVLAPPKLIAPSIQVNLRGGRLPSAGQGGAHFDAPPAGPA